MRKTAYGRILFLLVLLLIPTRSLSEPLAISIEINRQGKSLDLEEVVQILESGFQLLYPEKKYSVEVKAILAYEKIALPSGKLYCDLLLSEVARRGGNISAHLIFRTQGREMGRARVSARVDIMTQVLVARHYLGRHAPLEAKDVQWASRSLSLLPNDFLSEMKEVLGRRTTLAINKGEVLRTGMVEEPPLVTRGDRVRLMVENHQIKITALGEVREEGRKGDRIKLINLSSKKEVVGRVIDEHTVQIDF